MSVSLTIVGAPEAHLVFTNHVYLAPTNELLTKAQQTVEGKGEAYITLNEHIFIAKAHKSITDLNCGISSIQRETLGVPSNEVVPAAVYKVPTEATFRALTLKLEVFPLSTKRLTLKESDLVPIVRKLYVNQVFTLNQLFCCDYIGTAIKFQVKALEIAAPENKASDDGAITQYAKHALLVEKSVIEIEGTDTKYFKFEKSVTNKGRGLILTPDFKFADLGIGGLDAEFGLLFRRSFASRLFPPETAQKLGIKHVKGILLYGPPGTGKTLIARQIGKILAAREPKIVNGPEILNKFVGQSEENIRKLFADAEADYKANGENSDLHIIIFDEIDAICKTRGRGNDSTGVHDTIINQLLSKIDGVDQLNNILVIGMTNRKDMIDPALLRPGRLEVHIEIGLPDERGRLQILNIHTAKMRQNKMLAPDVNLEHLASVTKNFSGAEIEGLVKSASSFAMYRTMDITQGKFTPKDLTVTVGMDEFNAALDEVKPAFGVDEDELAVFVRGELYDYGSEFQRIINTGRALIKQVQNENTPLLSLLLEGPRGSGKTSIAAKLALESGFPYVKVISPVQFVGVAESKKVNDIAHIFEDSYKSPLSLIVLDNIEGLLEYIHVGPRFSAGALQALLTCITRVPPTANRKLMIIGTSSRPDALKDLELYDPFNVKQTVPALHSIDQFTRVLTTLRDDHVIEGVDSELQSIAKLCNFPIPIKQFLMLVGLAKQASRSILADKFEQCIEDTGVRQQAVQIEREARRRQTKQNFQQLDATIKAIKQQRDDADADAGAGEDDGDEPLDDEI